MEVAGKVGLLPVRRYRAGGRRRIGAAQRSKMALVDMGDECRPKSMRTLTAFILRGDTTDEAFQHRSTIHQQRVRHGHDACRPPASRETIRGAATAISRGLSGRTVRQVLDVNLVRPSHWALR